jgi:uncharacterized coiled-coil protein SlyX
VIYGDQDEGGAKSDRLAFQNTGAPSLEAILNEAHATLQENKRKLKRLVSKLKAKCLQANLNVEAFPEEVGMDGRDHRFGVLLTKQELEEALHRV